MSSRICGGSSTKARVVTFGCVRRRTSRPTMSTTWPSRDPRDRRSGPGPTEGFLTRFKLVCPLGRAADRAAHGRAPQRVQRACGRGGRRGGRREARADRGGPGRVRAVPGGCSSRRALSGAWLIDDSYNANPSSMRAGIEVLAQLDGAQVAGASGTWRELGDFAADAHTEIGAFARAHGIERLLRHRRARAAGRRELRRRRRSGSPTRRRCRACARWPLRCSGSPEVRCSSRDRA